MQDTAVIAHTVDITYSGNATATATYNWDFDGANVISGTGQGPYTVQWPSSGDKTVSLYVEESGNTSDTTFNDINIEDLTSYFLIDDIACIAHTVDITYTGNASDTATYNWDFDGATIISGSGKGPYIVQWSSLGLKTVSLYVEESGFVSDVTTHEIFIENLTSEFHMPDTAGRSTPIEIIYTGNASDAATYNWDFDGATIISGSGQGPYTVEWPTEGDKMVTLYVEEAGYISDTTSKNIHIAYLTSEFQIPDTACITCTVDIIYTGNASPSATYNWDFDGANIISGTGQGPYTVQWSSLGDKTVSLYVEESGQYSDTTTNEIYIENLTSDFQMPDTGYINSNVDIMYTGNALSSATYHWDFDGATVISGSGQGPYTVQWSDNGNKAVSLFVEESGFFSDTTTNSINIEILSSEFLMQEDGCLFDPEEIVYTGNATDSATYFWDFGGATIISGSGQGPYMVQWTSIGDKSVSLYVEESGYYSDTTIKHIFINEKPVFTIIAYPDDSVSTFDTITLSAVISSGSYLWSTGDTTQSIEVVNQSGPSGGCQNYWLEVTNDSGCSSTEYITVKFEGPISISDFPNHIEFNVYPNPFQNNLSVEINILEERHFVIEVCDYLGQSVIKESRHLQAGRQIMNINMDHAGPGVHVLSVKSDNGQFGVRKIIKSTN
jgi:hypothetical protein